MIPHRTMPGLMPWHWPTTTEVEQLPHAFVDDVQEGPEHSVTEDQSDEKLERWVSRCRHEWRAEFFAGLCPSMRRSEMRGLHLETRTARRRRHRPVMAWPQ